MLLSQAEVMILSPDFVTAPPRCAQAVSALTGASARMRMPGWVVIGSTGRNSGKTEVACAIIRAFRRYHPIVGVKVTAIREGESTCPRGGEGCGVCSNLRGNFEISEERGEHPGKDTVRMLESGASRVFWLRCKTQWIPAAVEALAPRLGQGALVVAESNSLARVIEPDLFLMVKNGDSSFVKPTAAEVIPLADRVVLAADGRRDFNPTRLVVVEGVWRIAQVAAAIPRGTGGKEVGVLSAGGA